MNSSGPTFLRPIEIVRAWPSTCSIQVRGSVLPGGIERTRDFRQMQRASRSLPRMEPLPYKGPHMPKKNVTKNPTVEGVLIAAAKTIGKAAGKIAAVVGATANAGSSPARSPRSKRSTKRPSKPGIKAKRVAKSAIPFEIESDEKKIKVSSLIKPKGDSGC